MRIEIFCEGYHDRAFWKGLLSTTQWEECRKINGQKIIGGRYGYQLNDSFLIVTPCSGDDGVRQHTKNRLKRLPTDPVDHIILNLDADTTAYSSQFARDKIQSLLGERELAFKDQKDHFLVTSPNGETRLSWVIWGVQAKAGRHLPAKQTLERLVCAASLKIYPDRGPVVTNFLAADPQGTEPGPKHYAWSYMAKWAADRGCDDFYSAVWEDDKIAAALRDLLTQTGAWHSIEAFLDV